jgi:hypothetical protein
LEKQKKSDCGKKLERERREIVGIERVRKFPKMEDVRKKVDEPNSGLREKVEFLSLEGIFGVFLFIFFSFSSIWFA